MEGGSVTALLIAVWYAFGTLSNIQAKQYLTAVPAPLYLTLSQYCAGSILSALLLLASGRTVSPTQHGGFQLKGREQKLLVTVCLINGVGHLMTNLSMGAVSISFTQTLKAAEPLFAMVLSMVILGSTVSRGMMLSLLPIISGIIVATTTELSYTHLGLITALASNLLFSSRNIYSKQLHNSSGMGSSLLYFYLCITGTCLVLLFLFVRSFVLGAPSPTPVPGAGWTLFVAATCHAVGNLVSFFVLERVSPLTHAVGGAMRRIFIIFCALLWLQTPINAVNLFGTIVACLGALWYSKAAHKHQQHLQSLQASWDTHDDDFLSV